MITSLPRASPYFSSSAFSPEAWKGSTMKKTLPARAM
jgi:hypothetical protein